MVGWHQQLNGHEFGGISGDGEGQGSLCAAAHGPQRFGRNLVTEEQIPQKAEQLFR